MKITFIKPNMGMVKDHPYLDMGRMEPFTFAVLKGLTPPEFETVLYDDRYETIDFNAPTDMVAINTEIYTAKRSYEISAQYRKRGIKVILGGPHPSMIPEEALANADSVCIGDAESVWPKLLADLKTGKLKKKYTGFPGTSQGFNKSQTSSPDWSIFKNKKYLRIRLTQLSRGCRYQCEYCATGHIFSTKYYYRNVDQVIDELRSDGSGTVFFVDENIVSDKNIAAELFEKLIPMKIHWISQADISFANDPNLLSLMVRSGCKGLVVGFESLSRENLLQMNKTPNLEWENYDSLVEKIRNAGLQLWAAFLLGYNDTPETVQQALHWALSKKFAFSAFNILMPYPGTVLYNRLKKENRLLFNGKWWLSDEYRFGMSGFKPRYCSAEELADACLKARLTHSSIKQIFFRALDRKTHLKSFENLVTYLMYNPLFRNEMKKKSGMTLGYRGYEKNQSKKISYLKA